MLHGKVVLITGAGRGIGRAYALILAAEGARLVVNDIVPSSQGSGVDPLVELLTSRGYEAVGDHSDISTWEGARTAVRRGIEYFGRLDGIVNNAGVLRRADVAEIEEADLDLEFAVNVKGAFACTHHASEYWRQENREGRRPHASVVNTTSDVIFTGSPGGAGYAATKAAIIGLTQSASLEGAQYGVRHNAVAPSGLTPMAAGSGLLNVDPRDAILPEDQDPDSPVNPIHNAPLVVWLLSDRAGHVTGQVFRLRFGAVARMAPVTSESWLLPPHDRHRWEYDDLEAVLNSMVFRSRFSAPVRESPDGTCEPFARLDHR
jgi:NAD(P)-dependent dehydrogenase (short-subunit alcohol dehydrogenase family)